MKNKKNIPITKITNNNLEQNGKKKRTKRLKKNKTITSDTHLSLARCITDEKTENKSVSADVAQLVQEIKPVEEPKVKKNAPNTQKNTPFRRVQEEELDENYLKKFGKNAFNQKKGAQGSWGEKANMDLIKTRGKSFRQEKSKKKRGSYRGGKIDTNVCSIKFDSD